MGREDQVARHESSPATARGSTSYQPGGLESYTLLSMILEQQLPDQNQAVVEIPNTTIIVPAEPDDFQANDSSES